MEVNTLRKKFLICRGSIILNKSQYSIADYCNGIEEDNEITRNKKFNTNLNSIVEDRRKEFMYYNRTNIAYSISIDEEIVLTTIGIQRKYKKNLPTAFGFKKEEDYTYDDMMVFFDRKTQHILIEYNSIDKPKTLTKKVEKFFNCYTDNEIYSLHIEPKFEKSLFWQKVQDGDYIISALEFNMLAPNFGGASSYAKDLARECHDKNNAERTILKLVSSDGLVLREDDVGLKGAVDYTSFGAGQWSFSRKKKNSKEKAIKIKSTDIAKVKAIEYNEGDKDKLFMEIRIILNEERDEHRE